MLKTLLYMRNANLLHQFIPILVRFCGFLGCEGVFQKDGKGEWTKFTDLRQIFIWDRAHSQRESRYFSPAEVLFLAFFPFHVGRALLTIAGFREWINHRKRSKMAYL